MEVLTGDVDVESLDILSSITNGLGHGTRSTEEDLHLSLLAGLNIKALVESTENRGPLVNAAS